MADHARENIDWVALMVPVATHFWGDPSQKGSAEMRWGKSGSRSVVLAKGVFNDHESGNKGGVLKLVEQETLITEKSGQMKWLQENGFIGRGETPRSGGMRGREPVKTYDYLDEAGKLLFQVCRFEPGRTLSNGTVEKKTFVQRKPDNKGGWTYKVAGLRQVPYRLPELLEDIKAGETIYIVEGEKDVDTLRSLGIPATSNPGGAGNWKTELSPLLVGADVVLVEDNDEPGRDHVRKVAASISLPARRVRTLQIFRAWPECPEKGDVTDWVKAGAKPQDIYRAVKQHAVEYEPEPFASQFGAILFRDMDQPWPEHQWLIKKILARGEVSLMAGPSGSGKTFEAMNTSMAIATGEPFHGYKVQHRGLVIYQAGESGKGMMKRWRAARDERGIKPGTDLPFALLPLPLNLYASDEDTEKLIEECRAIQQMFRDPLELVVIDTLASATAGANENTSEDMGPVLARCGRISRDLKCSVLLVHHMNADGTKARGWTGIQANVDGVIEISRGSGDEVDENGRHIRYGRLKKMKDGEDGLEWKFVLKNVEVGRDEDGDPITTCVINPPMISNVADPEAVERKRQEFVDRGFVLATREIPLMRALIKATLDHGEPVPPEFRAPEKALMVRDADWKRIAASSAFDSLELRASIAETKVDDAPDKVRDVRRALVDRIARFGEKMLEHGVIGRNAPYTWITGRPVRQMHFPWLPQPEKKPEMQPSKPSGISENAYLDDYMRSLGTIADDDLPL